MYKQSSSSAIKVTVYVLDMQYLASLVASSTSVHESGGTGAYFLENFSRAKKNMVSTSNLKSPTGGLA